MPDCQSHITLSDEIQSRLKVAFSTDQSVKIRDFNENDLIEIKLKSGRDEINVSNFITKLEWLNKKLFLEICKTPDHQTEFNDAAALPAAKILLLGSLAEYRVRANLGSVTSRSGSINRTNNGFSGKFTANFSFYNWIVESKNATPAFWVARVSEGVRAKPGNLIIQTGGRNYFAYLLKGLYEYVLIPERNLLMINLQDGQILDFYKLSQDQGALSYVFGQRINLSDVVGFDNRRSLCAQAASLLYENETPSGWNTPPLPKVETDIREDFLGSEVWEIPLFSRCSAALHSKSKVETNIAFMNYIDSLTSNIIPAYLQIQVGLEAFARSILASAGKLPRQTSIRVQKAFEHFGLELQESSLLEIKRRHAAVHEMMVSKAHGKLDGSEISRMEILRLLLSYLISKTVGYRGKLHHWRTPLRGRLISVIGTTTPATLEPLWQCDDETRDEACKKYFVDIN